MELIRLGSNDPRPVFDCGNLDLNEFFLEDSIESSKLLLSVTYVLMDEDKAIAFLSLSNDSVRKEDMPKSKARRFWRIFPREKRFSSMPAVKIGRLATCNDKQDLGVGTDLLDYMKVWFTDGNKTGCRFIVVDAYNNERVIHFYEKNGFQFLRPGDEADNTRLMYFDLITFAPE